MRMGTVIGMKSGELGGELNGRALLDEEIALSPRWSEDGLLPGLPVLDLIIGKSFFRGRDMLVMLW